MGKSPNWRRRPVFPLVLRPKEDVDRFITEDDVDATPEGMESRTARGKAIPWTEADMGEMSVVHSEDVEEAREDWRDKTLPGYEGLIDATEETEEE